MPLVLHIKQESIISSLSRCDDTKPPLNELYIIYDDYYKYMVFGRRIDEVSSDSNEYYFAFNTSAKLIRFINLIMPCMHNVKTTYGFSSIIVNDYVVYEEHNVRYIDWSDFTFSTVNDFVYKGTIITNNNEIYNYHIELNDLISVIKDALDE
jgi:hypothetical protein